MLERLVEARPENWANAFARQPRLVHYAIAVFGHSAWLGETLLQNSGLFRRFGGDEGLERSLSKEEYREEFARDVLKFAKR